MENRHVDVVVISDLHLGTYGCHAKEIVNYLQSISPNLLILNGDIVDVLNKEFVLAVAHQIEYIHTFSS